MAAFISKPSLNRACDWRTVHGHRPWQPPLPTSLTAHAMDQDEDGGNEYAERASDAVRYRGGRRDERRGEERRRDEREERRGEERRGEERRGEERIWATTDERVDRDALACSVLSVQYGGYAPSSVRHATCYMLVLPG